MIGVRAPAGVSPFIGFKPAMLEDAGSGSAYRPCPSAAMLIREESVSAT